MDAGRQRIVSVRAVANSRRKERLNSRRLQSCERGGQIFPGQLGVSYRRSVDLWVRALWSRWQRLLVTKECGPCSKLLGFFIPRCKMRDNRNTVTVQLMTIACGEVEMGNRNIKAGLVRYN